MVYNVNLSQGGNLLWWLWLLLVPHVAGVSRPGDAQDAPREFLGPRSCDGVHGSQHGVQGDVQRGLQGTFIGLRAAVVVVFLWLV